MKRFLRPQAFQAASQFIDNRRHRMNLPDAPIAQEGFFFDPIGDQQRFADSPDAQKDALG